MRNPDWAFLCAIQKVSKQCGHFNKVFLRQGSTVANLVMCTFGWESLWAFLSIASFLVCHNLCKNIFLVRLCMLYPTVWFTCINCLLSIYHTKEWTDNISQGHCTPRDMLHWPDYLVFTWGYMQQPHGTATKCAIANSCHMQGVTCHCSMFLLHVPSLFCHCNMSLFLRRPLFRS